MVDTLARMRQLIGTSSQWAANNIVLGDGEIGVEVVSSTVRRLKVGDGTRTWSALPYSSITQADLDDEIANRAAGDADLATDLAAETSARTSADSAEATTRGNADTAEAAARAAADATLQGNINAEAVTRGNADTALDTRVDALEAGAGTMGGDITALEAGLAAETAARSTADGVLQTNITAEGTARAAADTALDTRVDTLEAGTVTTAAAIAELEADVAANDGRLDVLEGQNLDSRVTVLEEAVATTLPPLWVKRATIGGVEKLARLHARFGAQQYWCDGVRDFDYLVAYEEDQATADKLYVDDDGVFRWSPAGEPIMTALGIKSFRNFSIYAKYNRDLRINWRFTYTGVGGGEFFTDGDIITFSGGGSGRYIAGETSILLMTEWTGAAPTTGQTFVAPNATGAVGATVNQIWTHENVTVTRDQVGIDGVANKACKVTATATNARIYQAVTIPGATRRTVAFLKRATGAGEIALSSDNAIWYPRTITDAWGRYASDKQTQSNAIAGIRIAVSGDAVIVDLMQSPERGPSQAEAYAPGWLSGLGTNEMPAETTNVLKGMPDSKIWCRRAVDSFLNDVTRFTVFYRITTLTADPGGTTVQFDTDGTSMDVAIGNHSSIGTASDNNFGVTYRTAANPGGFGNDPDGPKATANLAHAIAWTMNANDTGAGMALAMIAADGSAARVNVAHPPEHFPRSLRFLRFGSQWGTDLDPVSPSYNQGNSFITEVAVFDGVPTADELEDLVPGSVLLP